MRSLPCKTTRGPIGLLVHWWSSCYLWSGAPKTRAHQLLDGIEKRASNFMYQLLANELLPLSVRQDVAYLEELKATPLGAEIGYVNWHLPKLPWKSYRPYIQNFRRRASRHNALVVFCVVGELHQCCRPTAGLPTLTLSAWFSRLRYESHALTLKVAILTPKA